MCALAHSMSRHTSASEKYALFLVATSEFLPWHETNLFDSEDITGRFLHLAQFMQKVPKTRFGGHLVVREDFHLVYFGFGILLSRGLATNDHVQPHLQTSAKAMQTANRK